MEDVQDLRHLTETQEYPVEGLLCTLCMVRCHGDREDSLCACGCEWSWHTTNTKGVLSANIMAYDESTEESVSTSFS
jgi:hypothetical protein